jgi:aspartate racemase
MKVLGIIGGIAPESTVDYYRRIIAAWRERQSDGSYPALIINSIDLRKMIGFVEAQNLPGLTDYLLAEVTRLARAGAQVGLLASNTPHLVFDELQRRSPIPLVSIVEAACAAARDLGLTRVGLLGTRFTMQANFYPDVFARQGIAVVRPNRTEQEYVHDKYFGELVKAVFLPETRNGMLTVIERLRVEEKVQGVILGGTELPLLFRDSPTPAVRLLDTTAIHVDAAVAAMLA